MAKRKPKAQTKKEYVIGAGFQLNTTESKALLATFTTKFEGKKRLTDRALLAEARKKTSPAHKLFIWNKDEAHKKYLKQRAQYLVGAVQVQVVEVKTGKIVMGPTRVTVATEVHQFGRVPEGAYRSIEEVAGDDELKAIVLDRAKRDFEAWMARYERYNVFLNTFGPVLKAYRRVSTSQKRSPRTRRKKQ